MGLVGYYRWLMSVATLTLFLLFNSQKQKKKRHFLFFFPLLRKFAYVALSKYLEWEINLVFSSKMLFFFVGNFFEVLQKKFFVVEKKNGRNCILDFRCWRLSKNDKKRKWRKQHKCWLKIKRSECFFFFFKSGSFIQTWYPSGTRIIVTICFPSDSKLLTNLLKFFFNDKLVSHKKWTWRNLDINMG